MERFGAGLGPGTWLSLDMMGTQSAGLLPKQGLLFFGGICLALGVTYSQGPQPGCVLLPPPPQREVGIPHPP